MYSVHMLQILTNGWGDVEAHGSGVSQLHWRCVRGRGPSDGGRQGGASEVEGNKLHTAHTPNGMRAERATTNHRTALTDVIGVWSATLFSRVSNPASTCWKGGWWRKQSKGSGGRWYFSLSVLLRWGGGVIWACVSGGGVCGGGVQCFKWLHYCLSLTLHCICISELVRSI